jgi:hypothetical protein
VDKFKHWRQIGRVVEREFVPRWRGRAIASITPEEVAAMVEALVASGRPWHARAVYHYARQFFAFAVEAGVHGITTSPLTTLTPQALGLPLYWRKKPLDDAGVRAAIAASLGGINTRLAALDGRVAQTASPGVLRRLVAIEKTLAEIVA